MSLDYGRQDALMIRLSEKTAAAAIPGLPAGLEFRKLEAEPEEPLRGELRAFLEAVRTRESRPVTGREGRRALELAERVAEGIAEHARKLPAEMTGARARR